MPPALRATLTRLQQSGPDELALAADAAGALADLYAQAVAGLLTQTGTPREAVAALSEDSRAGGDTASAELMETLQAYPIIGYVNCYFRRGAAVAGAKGRAKTLTVAAARVAASPSGGSQYSLPLRRSRYHSPGRSSSRSTFTAR